MTASIHILMGVKEVAVYPLRLSTQEVPKGLKGVTLA